MTFWCTEELAEDIEQLRQEDDLSRAEFIRHAISQYVAWRKSEREPHLFSELERQELTEEILAALAEEAENEGKEANQAKKKPG